MFQKVMASFGQGGATVDARILDRHVRPGGTLRGEVLLAGGQVDQEVESLGVTLLARVEQDGGNGDAPNVVDLPFQNVRLAGDELVRAGARVKVPFEVRMPWETPITTVFGKYLTGMAVGLQTNLNLTPHGGRPAGRRRDPDRAGVRPAPDPRRDEPARLPVPLGQPGQGAARGADQQVPFFQEINFAPAPAFANVFTEVAVTFLTRPRDVQVVLDVHKRVRVLKGGGLGGRDQSMLGMFVVDATALGRTHWEQQIEGWLRKVAKPRGIFD